ncbi:hypothetical protein FA15DRAFT_297116 [Coprinopsis marcescibilis]|uniref:Uncharacterized protein n=1 Tax=Coprinopsis marcescibilis TaxID=230819 RepID=A0A5C3KCT1_COPMA|nr:hypothetical protein FA15DRAFT_297116 [Coprinopsis marcescibilis]
MIVTRDARYPLRSGSIFDPVYGWDEMGTTETISSGSMYLHVQSSFLCKLGTMQCRSDGHSR